MFNCQTTSKLKGSNQSGQMSPIHATNTTIIFLAAQCFIPVYDWTGQANRFHHLPNKVFSVNPFSIIKGVFHELDRI